MKSKYVNPFTDFGFKKIFGEEASKPLLIDFLNSLLPQHAHIANLSFRNTEHLGITIDDKKVIFDLYCENERGEKFIVEMQKAKQDFFKERTIFYSTFPIREQGEKGNWNFNLKAVFCVGILDFIFNDYASEPEKKQVIHEIKLRNSEGRTFYDKLTYIYLEMPNFRKKENELETRLDKWLYFINNLEDFESIPQIFKNEVVFIEAFEKAEISNFSQAELDNYENSIKAFRDLKNVIDTAAREGKEEGIDIGIEIGIEKVAKALKDNGVAFELISKTSGLTIEEIERL